jgi:hypothetical protein
MCHYYNKNIKTLFINCPILNLQGCKEEELMRYKNVPQLVKALVEVLSSQVLHGGFKKKWRGKYKVKEFNLTLADTHSLMDLYRKYILKNLNCEDSYISEFTSMYNICISLVVLQLPFSKT